MTAIPEDRHGPSVAVTPPESVSTLPIAPDAFLDAIAGELQAALGMVIDPRQLSPSALIRLLNSTPLGTVLSERTLRTHRAKAGFRIGSEKTVDLFRYAAWLAEQRHRPRSAPVPAAVPDRDAGQAHRDRMAQRSRDKQAAASEIGPVPSVVNRARREACRNDLARFLQEYFPFSTGLSPFSADHLRVIARLQSCAFNGGRFINAVYRGFAKTTIAENTVIWAILYGHRRFAVLIGADEKAAKGSMDSIKRELAENELLQQDFPEVCFAIEALEGKHQRCQSQTSGGELTHLEWTAEKIALPSVRLEPAAAAAQGIHLDPHGYPLSVGAVVITRGITGGMRGMKHKLPGGVQQRPDFIIVDDPQTDEGARSLVTIDKNLDVLKKAILNMGGHRKRIACVINATVIQPDDLVDQLLDPARNPAWQRERIPMVKSWATAHETFWLGDYARLRRTYDPDLADDQLRAHRDATELYRSRRVEADAGCVVSWESCFDEETEISAIQHAYNKLIDDGPDAFASECQQQPVPKIQTDAEELTVLKLQSKLTRLPRGVIPLACDKLTAFVDVQQKMLFFAVCAWGPGYGGCVIDYGTFPDQKRRQFTLRDSTRTLQHLFRGAGQEGAIYGGLEALTLELLGQDWKREDGTLFRINRCLVDTGYFSETVHTFCRQSRHAGLLCPSKGFGIAATQQPMSQYPRKTGETPGLEALIGPVGRGRRLLKYDTNFWKSFVRRRWLTAMGDKGSLALYGSDPEEHLTFCQQMVSEYSRPQSSNGRHVEIWDQRPGKPDNHWWDCVIGCAAGASFEGVALVRHEQASPARRTFKVPQHLIRN